MIVSFNHFFILPRNRIRGLWRIGDTRCSPQPVQMADHQTGLFQLWTQLPDLCGLCDEHLFRDHDSRLADLPHQPGQKTQQKDFFSAHCLACPFLDSAFCGKSQCLRSFNSDKALLLIPYLTLKQPSNSHIILTS